MNIYLQELRMSYKSMIYWTVGICSLVVLYMSMFQAMSQDYGVIQKIASKFPEQLRRALGLSNLDLSKVIGFYGFIFVYILLFGSIYAMKSGMGALSEEVRSKTADFLLAKPVKRITVAIAKLFSILTMLVIQNSVYCMVSFACLTLFGKMGFDASIFYLISISLMLVQLFFVSLGLFMSALITKIKTVLPPSLGVVFGFFMLYIVSQSVNDPKLAYLTPFAYFETARVIESGGYSVSHYAANIAAAVAFTAAACFIYCRKDMPSV